MMPIHAKTNLYPGVNAHLNSFLQQPGGDWEMFHSKYINVLQEYLDPRLPANYYAVIEKSLQVSVLPPIGDMSRRTRPDVAIFETQLPRTSGTGGLLEADAPIATFPLADLMIDDDFGYMAVAIYRMDAGYMDGVPVTRIELLSPSNKPPAADYEQYKLRRMRTLRADIALVEIDYLHQTPPVHPRLPVYARGEAGALPYYIAIDVPRPTSWSGDVNVYGAGVDTRLLRVPLPLAGDEHLVVDMNDVYHQVFERMRAFELLVDYAVDPVDFDRYHPDDRARIRALLEGIRREHGEGNE
jgi:hypothetical protein